MWGGISLQEDGDATILHDRKFWLTQMRMGMKNAHLPFGWLTCYKRTEITTTTFKLRLDRFIGEVLPDSPAPRRHILPLLLVAIRCFELWRRGRGFLSSARHTENTGKSSLVRKVFDL